MSDQPISLRASTALFLNERGEVLAVSRKENHADLGLPGGRLEPGETFAQAIIREVREEVGVRVCLMTDVFDHPDRGYYAHTFMVHHWEGEPYSVEGAAVLWVHPDRLLDPVCSFHEYNRALFEHLGIRVSVAPSPP